MGPKNYIDSVCEGFRCGCFDTAITFLFTYLQVQTLILAMARSIVKYVMTLFGTLRLRNSECER